MLTNCESYDKFPPDQLKRASALSRTLPRLAGTLIRLQLRTSPVRRKVLAGVAASGLDQQRTDSFFGPARRDPRVAADLVAAMAGFRPQLLLDAAAAISQFNRPVLLIWGDSCEFFPVSDARRLAAEFPSATLLTVPGAKTWVPIDNPVLVTDAIADFVPSGPQR